MGVTHDSTKEEEAFELETSDGEGTPQEEDEAEEGVAYTDRYIEPGVQPSWLP